MDWSISSSLGNLNCFSLSLGLKLSLSNLFASCCLSFKFSRRNCFMVSLSVVVVRALSARGVQSHPFSSGLVLHVAMAPVCLSSRTMPFFVSSML